MHKGKFPPFCNFISVLVTLLIGAAGLWASDQINIKKNDPADTQRADLILIDAMAEFGPLQRPEVAFLHDKHTQALEKQKKDCTTCHPQQNGKLSPKFKRSQDSEALHPSQIMDIYHDNCIACHTETAGRGMESGPVTCGDCHLKEIDLTSIRKPMGFNHSLHYRHVQAQEKKCEGCHHEYNAETKKLFYAKGKEGTCRYCHEAETEENRISMRLASHQQCINCHRDKLAQELNAGPIHCQGCHSRKAQEKIEKVADFPRMERNQPDAVLIRAAAEETAAENPPSQSLVPEERISPVAFNHKAHEGYNDTCRSCHHASMAACTSCHTPAGHPDGKNIRLAQAMHQSNATSSCIGCHTQKQQAPQCAGCHAPVKGTANPKPTTCNSCHVEGDQNQRAPMTKEEAASIAAAMIAAGHPETPTYAIEDIPEKVVIQKLSNTYQGVELPHRKIVLKLMDNIKEDNIAKHFHTDAGTLCQGCHHNSPPSKTPPACSSCHGQPFDGGNPNRPGLMGAYHEQCFACHSAMKIEKPKTRECTTCHPLKEAS